MKEKENGRRIKIRNNRDVDMEPKSVDDNIIFCIDCESLEELTNCESYGATVCKSCMIYCSDCQKKLCRSCIRYSVESDISIGGQPFCHSCYTRCFGAEIDEPGRPSRLLRRQEAGVLGLSGPVDSR
ncbi:MAG: hypothetical protein ACTSRA_19180 [Promethearchaeota archaeon]